MTHQEFLDVLREENRGEGDLERFHVGGCQELRCTLKDQHLRGEYGYYCPITYVAKKTTGSHWTIGDWKEAAEDIGLENPGDIVDASDRGNVTALRRKLLEAAGITMERRSS